MTTSDRNRSLYFALGAPAGDARALLVSIDGRSGIVAQGDFGHASAQLCTTPALRLYAFGVSDAVVDSAPVQVEDGPTGQILNLLLPLPRSGLRRWFTMAEVARAWVGAVLIHGDARADTAALMGAAPDSLGSLLRDQVFSQPPAVRAGIAFRAKSLLLRLVDRPVLDASCRVDDLLPLVRGGDRGAARLLEELAWEQRDLPLWRYAMAIADGQSLIARTWQGRCRQLTG